jgi:hypothetical protein
MDSTSTFPNSTNFIDDSLSKGDWREEEEIVDNNFPTEEILIEELYDHGMN